MRACSLLLRWPCFPEGGARAAAGQGGQCPWALPARRAAYRLGGRRGAGRADPRQCLAARTAGGSRSLGAQACLCTSLSPSGVVAETRSLRGLPTLPPLLRDAAPRPPHTRTPATPARGVQTRLTLARGVQTRLAVRKVKGPVCTPRKNRPERRSRLKESVVVSLSLPILFGRHRMRMTPCTPEQARTNRKITTMLHKRAILRANMRAEATGDRLSGMTLVSTRSSSDTRLNIPRCVLTRVLFSILWCDHSFLRVRTRSAACNSSGRRLHRGRQGVSARLLCLNVRCNDKSLRCSQSTAWRSLPPAHQVYGRSPKTCKR